MINSAFIGFGKSATRYHLPYVLVRKDKFNVSRIFDRVRVPAREQQPEYAGIQFTSQVEDILNDPTISLVTVCTHPDSHFYYAKLCLEHGKKCAGRKAVHDHA